MPKMHLKFDNQGASLPKTAAPSPHANPNAANRGMKRNSERNPKTTDCNPKNIPPTNTHAPVQNPGGFYGKNKKRKIGGGGFQPTNKLKDKTRRNGDNIGASRLGPIHSKPVAKSSSSTNLQAKSHPPDADEFAGDKLNAKHELKPNLGDVETSGPEPASLKPAPKNNSSNASASSLDHVNSKPVPNTNSSNIDTPKSDSVSSMTASKSGVSPDIQALMDKYKPDSPRRIRWPTQRHRNAEGKRKELLVARRNLPIWLHQTQIRGELRQKDVMLLVGETGSGKSTQVPQFICNEPWAVKQRFQVGNRAVFVGGVIAITQPRRIAATTLAKRVAEEMGCVWDHQDCEVGYAVRFDKFTPKAMRIKFLTEGMLMQELLTDPHLTQYSAVIVDEVHERTMNVDLMTGFLKQIVAGDKKGRHGVPLKVIIMSATANMEPVLNFFEDGQTPESRRSSNASQTTDISYSSWEGFSNDEDSVKGKDSNINPGDIKGEDISHAVNNAETTNRRNSDSSATLDEQAGDKVIESRPPGKSNAVVHHVEGRQHPVKLFYTPVPLEDYIDAMVRTVKKIHMDKEFRDGNRGDILCFLTGQEEIEALKKLIETMAASLPKNVPFLKVMTLYGKMSPRDQQEVFRPLGMKRTRKVVLSTNIAETSVTVQGVRYVVDSGKAKMKQFRHNLGIESILIKPISQSSANQRKGRAGREAEGECYRLYTESQYLDLPTSDVPEILRTDVTHAVLTMKVRGIQDPHNFPLMDPPESSAITKAISQLLTLGALSEDGSVTGTGREMAYFPLSPAYARVIIAAAGEGFNCLFEAIDAIACLSADGDIFKLPPSDKFREETQSARDSLNRREGDILTELNTMQRYLEQRANSKKSLGTWCEQHQVNSVSMQQAILIRKQLQEICVKQRLLPETSLRDIDIDFDPITEEKGQALLKCFLKAFSDKIAILHPDKSYRTMVTRDVIAIHPSSVLQGKKCEAILYLEQVYTSKHFAKKVNMVQMDWVMETLKSRGA